MIKLPLYARPAVGFVQWHLRQGDTDEDIIAQLRRQNRFERITGELLQKVFAQARRNQELTELFCAGGKDITVDQCKEALRLLEDGDDA